jgi:hypothetical protein
MRTRLARTRVAWTQIIWRVMIHGMFPPSLERIHWEMRKHITGHTQRHTQRNSPIYSKMYFYCCRCQHGKRVYKYTSRWSFVRIQWHDRAFVDTHRSIRWVIKILLWTITSKYVEWFKSVCGYLRNTQVLRSWSIIFVYKKNHLSSPAFANKVDVLVVNYDVCMTFHSQ